ncbi:MAG: ArsR/SmtB family transcription factor [Rhodospirillales bacterium]
MSSHPATTLDDLLVALKAVAEPTRLRLLQLCGLADLTVTDLTGLLGQSQPRVSRHLKLMVESGLLERHREGSFAYFRLTAGAGSLGSALLALLPAADNQLHADRQRLETVIAERGRRAESYFRDNAERWDEIRKLTVREDEVERVLLDLLESGSQPVRSLLDIGTGTGRILQLLAPKVDRALGVDRSPEMLRIARAALDRDGLRQATVQQGTLDLLPGGAPGPGFDLAVMHQVLHYAEQPADAIQEAARVLNPDGRLVIVDFESHDRDSLREEHAHRWLGFRREAVTGWMKRAGLVSAPPLALGGGSDEQPLTVLVWVGLKSAPAPIAR